MKVTVRVRVRFRGLPVRVLVVVTVRFRVRLRGLPDGGLGAYPQLGLGLGEEDSLARVFFMILALRTS